MSSKEREKPKANIHVNGMLSGFGMCILCVLRNVENATIRIEKPSDRKKKGIYDQGNFDCLDLLPLTIFLAEEFKFR